MATLTGRGQSRIGLVVLALACLLLGLWLGLRGPVPERVLAAAVVAGQPVAGNLSRTQAADPAVAAVSAAQLPVSKTLPPDDAPLAIHHAELAARALRGDLPATRRLVHDLRRCEGVRIYRAMVEPGQQQDVHLTWDAAKRTQAVQTLLEGQARNCVYALQCADVSDEQVARVSHWLLHAARLGDRDAQVEFAGGATLTATARLPAYDDVPLWRAQALPWMQQAITEGDPRALRLMANALDHIDGGFETLLAQLVDQDRVLAHAYRHALARANPADLASQRSLQASAQRLSASERADALAQGEALYSRHRERLDRAAADPVTAPEWLQRPRLSMADVARRAPQCLDAAQGPPAAP